MLDRHCGRCIFLTCADASPRRRCVHVATGRVATAAGEAFTMTIPVVVVVEFKRMLLRLWSNGCIAVSAVVPLGHCTDGVVE